MLKPGMLWIEKVWAHNICIDFLAELDQFKTMIFDYFCLTNFLGGLIYDFLPGNSDS